MEKQVSGLIALNALDTKSRARALCKYQLGERSEAELTATQLPIGAYIAVLWSGGAPVILGEMKKTPEGYAASGRAGSKAPEAAFVAKRDFSAASVVLAGKAMGSKLDMDKALLRVRMLGKKPPGAGVGVNQGAEAMESHITQDAPKPAPRATAPQHITQDAPKPAPRAAAPHHITQDAPPASDARKAISRREDAPEHDASGAKVEREDMTECDSTRDNINEHGLAAHDIASDSDADACECMGEMDSDGMGAGQALLERFIGSGSGRAIAPSPHPVPRRQGAQTSGAGHGGAHGHTPAPQPAKKHKSPSDLLRRGRPSYSRPVSNPFPGDYPGAQWTMVRYPGAQHTHYLAGRWKHGGFDLLISAVPGSSAPAPPPWLSGFAKYQTSRWGQGYWVNITDY